MQVTTVGLDLAKHVFQVHGIDQNGQVLIRRQLRRGELIGFFRRLPPCLIGMEACSTAHFWARELAALGHEVPKGFNDLAPRDAGLLRFCPRSCRECRDVRQHPGGDP
jgi:hypothetical protein